MSTVQALMIPDVEQIHCLQVLKLRAASDDQLIIHSTRMPAYPFSSTSNAHA